MVLGRGIPMAIVSDPERRLPSPRRWIPGTSTDTDDARSWRVDMCLPSIVSELQLSNHLMFF